jgi:hypothetical protein
MAFSYQKCPSTKHETYIAEITKPINAAGGIMISDPACQGERNRANLQGFLLFQNLHSPYLRSMVDEAKKPATGTPYGYGRSFMGSFPGIILPPTLNS